MFLQHKNDPGQTRFHKPNILRRKLKTSATPIGNESHGLTLVIPTAPSKNSLDYETNNAVVEPATEPKLSQDCTRDAEEDINSNLDVCLNRTLFDSDSCELKISRSPLLGSTFMEPECMEDDIIQFVLEPIELFETGTSLDLITIENSIPSVTEDVPEADSTHETIMFKCDYEDCKKSFPTKQKLKKHIARHMKAKPQKDAQQILKCPAIKPKTSELDDTPIVCDRVFEVKKDLLKHLTNDHSQEDGIHSCEKCGRRFFTVTGFRVHRRTCGSPVSRRVLACPWEGCSRTFLQPCRLREHSRAHTGDRPYPCHHPGCPWSFRTASKLLRHARRHTGERRHACVTCGLSFRRREHLRDHTRRHVAATVLATDVADSAATTAKRPRRIHAALSLPCSYHDCDQLFKDAKSLNAHIRSVHEKIATLEEIQQVASTAALWTSENDSFMEEPEIIIREEPEQVLPTREESELRCARTHCTWPLIATSAPSIAAIRDHDAQVELSEGSESNTSTIRSDLFLHGNMLPIEDNDAVGSVVEADEADEADEACVAAAALSRSCELAPEPYSGHVALLHAGYEHLTRTPIDLLQEELMYTDTAVDESSFQILLLSDPDLN